MKLSRITLGALILAVILGTALLPRALSNTPYEPPELKIMAGSEGEPLPYVILKNKWNGAIFDRLSYSQVLMERLEQNEKIPEVDFSEPITLDFGKYKPDSMRLIVDYNTSPVWSYRTPVWNVKTDGLSFKHPSTPKAPVAPADWTVRFYVLTATWGENEAEYAFAVRVKGEPVSGEKPVLTWEVVQALAAGEITPAYVVETYRHRDVTSGIYSFYSELPDSFALMIGFTDIKDPFYIHLIDTTVEDAVELTEASIEEFRARRVK